MLDDVKPDVVVRVRAEQKIAIFDVACTWDRLVQTRERQKKMKYQELAADLATQFPEYRVTVTPVVIGTRGLIAGLKDHLRKSQRKSGVFKEEEVQSFVSIAQREVLCSGVQMIQRHMKA